MKAEEIRNIAQNHQLAVKGLSKANMIRKIQLHEGNLACYASTFRDECGQSGCLWRNDCLKSPVD